MHVILVRHGHAKKGYSDHERPLTEEGVNEITRLANYLAERESIRQIWHSGILRARQTAGILADQLEPESGLIEAAHLQPDSRPEIISRQLNNLEHDVLIVSHLPYLEYLTNLLITGDKEWDTIQYRPGSAAKLKRTDSQWKLIWAVSPDELPTGET